MIAVTKRDTKDQVIFYRPADRGEKIDIGRFLIVVVGVVVAGGLLTKADAATDEDGAFFYLCLLRLLCVREENDEDGKGRIGRAWPQHDLD